MDAASWSGLPDLGLNRSLDLSQPAVRARTVRRRLLLALWVVPLVLMLVAGMHWPDLLLEPGVRWPFSVTLVGLGFMGLAVVLALLTIPSTVRAGLNPFDNRDPSRILSRSDRAWVRARVAAGAPVGQDQHAVVATSADWMSRQTGTVPSYVSLTAMGIGIGPGNPGLLSILVGLGLVVEGIVLARLAVTRSRTARRWLALYAPERLDSF